jgi:hypothetical protein
VLVQDSPALNNLDWSGNFDASLDQAIAGGFAEVVVLPQGSINKYQPTLIYTNDTIVYRLPQRQVPQVHTGLIPVGINLPQDECQNGQAPPAQCREEAPIYLVRALP